MKNLLTLALLSACLVFARSSNVPASDASVCSHENGTTVSSEFACAAYSEGSISGRGDTQGEAHADAQRRLPKGAKVTRTSYHQWSSGKKWSCTLHYKRN